MGRFYIESINIEEALPQLNTYPRLQVKLSNGLTLGTLEVAIKLPSTYILAFPGTRV
jgi:hypothetical protein